MASAKRVGNSVVLTLTKKEAQVLAEVLSHVEGPENSLKKFTDEVLEVLIQLGFDPALDIAKCTGSIVMLPLPPEELEDEAA